MPRSLGDRRFVFFARDHTFNEKLAIKRLTEICDELDAALAPAPPDSPLARFPYSRENKEHLLHNLAWTVVATGEYAKGSDELKQVLFKIQKKLGTLAVPYWIRPPDRQTDIYVRLCFVDESGDWMEPFTIAPVLDSRGLYGVVLDAQLRITARSGYVFSGYDGEPYMGTGVEL